MPKAHLQLIHSRLACASVWIATRVSVVVVGWQVAPHFVGDKLGPYQAWGQTLVSTGTLDGDSWQSPPLTAPLLALAAGAQLMPWSFIVLALVADACILIILLALARRGASWLGPWCWAVSALIIGLAIFAKLDIFSALFAVLAICLARRSVGSGILAGLGTLMKLWPAFVLESVPRSKSGRALISWALTLVSVGGAIALVWPSTLTFVWNQARRGLEAKSAGALPLLYVKALGGDVPIAFR